MLLVMQMLTVVVEIQMPGIELDTARVSTQEMLFLFDERQKAKGKLDSKSPITHLSNCDKIPTTKI